MIRFILLLTLYFSFSTITFAEEISVVSVSGFGFGQNEAEAVSDAVINGIAQVNGESIASSIRISKKTSSTLDQGTKSERNIESDLQRRTKGIVKSWSVTSTESDPSGGYNAKVKVNVFVLNKSEQLKRYKLSIVAGSRNPDENTSALVSYLVSNLTSSRKFSIMDRQNDQAINDQIDRIRQGGVIQDKVRIGSEVAPDFIAVTSLRILTGPKISAEAKLEILDYSTRQVKFSDTKSITLRSADSQALNKKMSSLATVLSRSVIETLYPPTIVAFDQDTVTIAQGADFFSIGDQCLVKEVTGTLKDPYTKEYLSYETSDIGRAEITYVDKRISKAKLLSPVNFSNSKIASRKYQVSRTGDSANELFNAMTKSESKNESDW
jgi:hypothetical protein